MDRGEALIAEVYRAVRSSPSWNDTLLLIVYDEHGGLFDHVTPPTLTRDPQYPDIPPTKDFGFRFDRLGVRVPAVFVSPRIQAGTILRQQFDHCSIVATVRKLFCLDQTPFNWREAQALTFEGIANLADDQLRDDTVALAAPVVSDGTIAIARDLVLPTAHREASPAEMPAGGVPPVEHVAAAGAVTASAPPVLSPQVRKPTDLVMLMAQAMQHTLQVMGHSTQKKVSQIHSAQDASDYLQEATTILAQRRWE